MKHNLKLSNSTLRLLFSDLANKSARTGIHIYDKYVIEIIDRRDLFTEEERGHMKAVKGYFDKKRFRYNELRQQGRCAICHTYNVERNEDGKARAYCIKCANKRNETKRKEAIDGRRIGNRLSKRDTFLLREKIAEYVMKNKETTISGAGKHFGIKKMGGVDYKKIREIIKTKK